MNSFVVTGLMSGSSLDGLDITQVEFNKQDGQWGFSVLASQTEPFPENLKQQLSNAHSLPTPDLCELDAHFGQWCGKQAAKIERATCRESLFIASHGHTVFHQPGRGFSLQIGHGAHLAHTSQKPVVCDFRTTDIANGGQGAPLVPYGEKLLFPSIDAFLNLGGIANLTIIDENDALLAWDIIGFNQVLNYLSKDLPEGFDRNGERARNGNLLIDWIANLRNWEYLHKSPPKSLGNENIRSFIHQFLLQGDAADLSHSYCYFAAETISEAINTYPVKNIMVTGGGTYHNFFIELLKSRLKKEIEVNIPTDILVENKEALVFAFLGLLRWLGLPNAMSGVTGSIKNSSGGCIYIP